MYAKMKSGFPTLQKHNFTNQLITKTAGIKGKDQIKLKQSMNILLQKFDFDNCKNIDYEEFRRNQWWIEVFFEGYWQLRWIDKNNSFKISVNDFKKKLPGLYDFKKKLPGLYLPLNFPFSPTDKFEMFNPVSGEVS